MFKGIDCASKLNATTAKKAKDAGYSFVGRYLVPASYWKALTFTEAKAISDAGLKILSIWETTASRSNEGAAAGAADGKQALALAQQLQIPKTGYIYFAVDYAPTSKDYEKIKEYFTAAKAACAPYEIGIYGSYFVIEEFAKLGICKGYWQCVGWSSGKKSNYLTVYQSQWSGSSEAKAAATKIGVSVDINECPDMDKAGLWNYQSETKEETPVPTSSNSFVPTVFTTPTIGHARGDERGGASGGVAGDQTGKEVTIQAWYNGNWNKVIRAKNRGVAEAMARNCELACRNDLIGYDQGQRNTLWDVLDKVGWDFTKISTACETDCSALMHCCAKGAGIEVPRVYLGSGKYNCVVTWTMCDAFKKTGLFEILTDNKYLQTPAYLLRGDILVRESGHTAMYLTQQEDDEMVTYDDWKNFMNQYRAELRDNDSSPYSEEARAWAINSGLVVGGDKLPDGSPNYMWEDPITREQMVTLFFRFKKMIEENSGDSFHG